MLLQMPMLLSHFAAVDLEVPMTPNPLHAIMHPKSIVVAGASNNFMKMGAIQALNLLHCGFTGEILFLHPTEKELMGHPTYATPDDLPYAPDLAFLVTPTGITPKLIEGLGRRGVKYAVIVTAGFREVGGDGIELEHHLIEAADKHGLRFIGPNCIGIVNTHLPLNLTVFPYIDKPGHVGLISQSGTYVAQSIPYLQKRGIRYSQAISVGNASNIDIVDCLEYLGEDPETKAIALYIEGIKRGREFISVARRVSRSKPIVALYVGGSEAGSRSVSSHTGSMGTPDVFFNGVLEQAGIIRAKSVEDLFSWTHALASMPIPKGKRMAILTHSGGPASSMADACEKNGLSLPEFSQQLQQRIKPMIEPTASAKNPIDLTFTMDHEALVNKIPEILFESDEVDGVLVHGIMDTGFIKAGFKFLEKLLPISLSDLEKSMEFDLSKLVALPHQSGKPMTASTFLRDDHAAQTFVDHDIPLFAAPDHAVHAMAALSKYADIHTNMSKTPDFDVHYPKPSTPLPHTGRTQLDEYDAKKLLAEYGVLCSQEERVTELSEACEAAKRIGYPVVLKGLPSNVAHKSEAGLVHLALSDEKSLHKAWMKIEDSAPGCPRLVAQMLSGERELVIGMTRFDAFGPAVMLGIGGIFTEAISDATFRVAPVTKFEAKQMPNSLKLNALFDSLRGLPEVNRDLLANSIQAVATLALEHPEISEIDINPLLVVNGRPIAVDALIVLENH